MRLTKTALREMGIVNPYDLAKGGGGLMLVVSYRPQDNERGGHSAALVADGGSP
jgi:hypothetical protein